MANHTSAIKSIRKNKSNQLLNRYKYKSARTETKKLRNSITSIIQKGKLDEKELLKYKYKIILSKFDKLAKKKIIHKNKAANLKSKIAHIIDSI